MKPGRGACGELQLLAPPLWGASFLFMRVGVPEFGGIALAALRVASPRSLLVPVLLWRGAMVGAAHALAPDRRARRDQLGAALRALRLCRLSISAGLAAIFNASAPLFGAVVGWFWLGDRLTPARSLGLAIGFAGVVWPRRRQGRAAARRDRRWRSSLVWERPCATASRPTTPSSALRAPGAAGRDRQPVGAALLALPAVSTWPAARRRRGPPGSPRWLLAVVCTWIA